MQELRSQLRRYLTGAWRHRWLAVGAAWLLCLAGWAAVSLIPNQYEANARLYVEADAVLTPLLKGLALDNTVNSQLELLQQTLLSRPNLERLVSKTDLEQGVAGPAARSTSWRRRKTCSRLRIAAPDRSSPTTWCRRS